MIRGSGIIEIDPEVLGRIATLEASVFKLESYLAAIVETLTLKQLDYIERRVRELKDIRKNIDDN